MQDNKNQLYEENKGIYDKHPHSFLLKTLKGSTNIAKCDIKGDWRCFNRQASKQKHTKFVGNQ